MGIQINTAVVVCGYPALFPRMKSEEHAMRRVHMMSTGRKIDTTCSEESAMTRLNQPEVSDGVADAGATR